MNIKLKSFLLGVLTLLSFQAISAKNPIGWQLNQSFSDPVFVGRASTITYTFTNQLPVTLVKPIQILKNASPQTEFSYVDACSGKKLLSNESCTVQVTLNPLVNGIKYLQLVIAGYDSNQVPLPQVVTQAAGEVTGDVTGSVTQSLPGSTTAGSSANYTFTFTNHSTTTATNLSAAVTQTAGTVNVTSNTCSGSLGAGLSCAVSGTYVAVSSPSTQGVTATLSYGGASGSPVAVTTSTTVTTPAGDIVATLVSPNYLPALMVQNTTYTVQFLFTNETTHSVTVNGAGARVTCATSNTSTCPTLTQTSNSCATTTSLPTTAACQITVTFTAPTATNPPTTYTLTGSMSFTGTGTPATISTIGTVVSSLPTSRTITFVNQCSFPVWFSLNGGSVDGQSCAAGCPTGTACDSSTGKCYWENYAPTNNTYQLAASGGTNSVSIPVPTFNSGTIQWSGNISASTLCNPSLPNGTCRQASCSNHNGSTACAPGQGFIQPATQAEITMGLTTVDSYDVEVINGFHIPISMAPMNSGVAATADNYSCGVPGNSSAGNGFGACDWQTANPPSTKNGYYWVTSGGATCNINTSTSQCGSGQLCGLDSSFNQTCGNFLGYWSADQVCSNTGLSTTVSNYFLCTQALPSSSFPAGAQLYQLMACAVPPNDTAVPLYNSCYLSYSGATADQIATCCGCADWWNPSQTNGQVIGANSTSTSCTQSGQASSQTDPQWNSYVQPMIQWMKAACPSAYTYPFDDKTSSFTCTNNLPNQPNSVGYTITFCSGNSGLPEGINEGR